MCMLWQGSKAYAVLGQGILIIMIKYILYYLLAISTISAVMCVVDKMNAIRGSWRVRERDLFLLCIMGGSAVMYLVMRIIHHKTHHNRFMIGIPIIFLLQVAAVAAIVIL